LALLSAAVLVGLIAQPGAVNGIAASDPVNGLPLS
jgi:hypothetical protein